MSVPLPQGLLVDHTARFRIAHGEVILQQAVDEAIAAPDFAQEKAFSGIIQEVNVVPWCVAIIPEH